MFRTLATALAIATALPVATGCDAEEPNDEIEFSDGDVESRGWGFARSNRRLNTNAVTAGDIHTVNFGANTNYGAEVVFIDAPMGEVELDSVKVVDGAITGKTIWGNSMGPEDFNGSVWEILVDGQLVTTKITAVEKAGAVGLYDPEKADMLMLDPGRYVYEWYSPDALAAGTPVDSKDPDAGTYNGFNTCAPGAGVIGAWSVIYDGLIVDENTGDFNVADPNDRAAYIGCLSGAVGKSAVWGYTPDSPDLPSLTQAEFEGAVRMLRSDYCADGQSFTQPGEAVTIADHYGINQHAQNDIESDEGVWGENGILCLNNARVQGTGPVSCNGVPIPDCASYGISSAKVYAYDPDARFWTLNGAW